MHDAHAVMASIGSRNLRRQTWKFSPTARAKHSLPVLHLMFRKHNPVINDRFSHVNQLVFFSFWSNFEVEFRIFQSVDNIYCRRFDIILYHLQILYKRQQMNKIIHFHWAVWNNENER